MESIAGRLEEVLGERLSAARRLRASALRRDPVFSRRCFSEPHHVSGGACLMKMLPLRFVYSAEHVQHRLQLLVSSWSSGGSARSNGRHLPARFRTRGSERNTPARAMQQPFVPGLVRSPAASGTAVLWSLCISSCVVMRAPPADGNAWRMTPGETTGVRSLRRAACRRAR